MGQRVCDWNTLERSSIEVLMPPLRPSHGADSWTRQVQIHANRDLLQSVWMNPTLQETILPKGNVPGALGHPGPGHRPAHPGNQHNVLYLNFRIRVQDLPPVGVMQSPSQEKLCHATNDAQSRGQNDLEPENE